MKIESVYSSRRYILKQRGVIMIFSTILILVGIIIALICTNISLKREYDSDISDLGSKIVSLKQENNELIDEISDLVTNNEYLSSESDRLNTLINKKTLNISSEEFKLLASVVHCESNTEPYEGQIAVARVVLNRWIGSKWNDSSIREVIYHPGQFNQILDKIDKVVPTAANYCAVVDAINNTINMPVEVDSFETISSGTQNGSSYERWKTIGGHNFNILKKGMKS